MLTLLKDALPLAILFLLQGVGTEFQSFMSVTQRAKIVLKRVGICSFESHTQIQISLISISVSRCWNKKLPKCFKKFAQKPKQLFFFPTEPQKATANIWPTFVRKFVTMDFQKSPNLVPLFSIPSKHSNFRTNFVYRDPPAGD